MSEPINYAEWNYNPMTGEKLWGEDAQLEQVPLQGAVNLRGVVTHVEIGQEDDFCKEFGADRIYSAPVAQPAVAEQHKQEPFGYFKPEPFGWTDCAETDEGAIALYAHPPASKPLTDELLNATKMAIQCSHMDHGRRSVNAQAWDRMIQAIAAHTHAIEAAHGIKE